MTILTGIIIYLTNFLNGNTSNLNTRFSTDSYISSPSYSDYI